MRAHFTLLTAAVATVALLATPASAACKRYGFTVNDYGKDGPTKDAKDLLDKHIATQMSENGIKTYKTGEKTVKCELFLDFIVFDEHTCTAEATVCWGDSAPSAAQQAKAKSSGQASKQTTGSIDKAKAKDEPIIEGASEPSAPAAPSSDTAAATSSDAAPATSGQ